MFQDSFSAYPSWLNVAVFLLCAAAIWFAGSRLTVFADIIADRSGLGEAFVGLVFLAGATSLPEIGRTIAASALGHAVLAVNSLFGGIVLQTAILAVADLVVAQRALTYFAPRPVLLVQGAVVVLLLGLALAGIAAGEMIQLFGVGLWTTVLAGLYLYSLHVLKSYERREQWRPVNVPHELKEEVLVREGRQRNQRQRTLARIVLWVGILSSIILVAGVLLAEVGDALAVQTGLGAGFIGATLLAFASSLPELSTTIAAVRLGAYSMAISNIFGSNALLVALLFLSDAFYRQGPVLEAVDRSAVFAASTGVVTTSIYLLGMLERRNRVLLGMGLDSLVVLLVYAVTLVVTYLLR